jgi:DNA primase
MTDHRTFLDFRAIKSRVPISSLLSRYGVHLKRVNQASLKGNCPLPSHSSKSRDTFYVNEAKSVWCCHSDSCKKNGNRTGGNVIDFVALMESLSPYDAARHLEVLFPADGSLAKAEQTSSTGTADHERPEAVESEIRTNKPLAFTLKDIDHGHPMILERGISIETARLFGIGFFTGKGSMAGRIVFPLKEHGQLVGYAGRTTLPLSPENPKWLLGKGLKKSFLYGLERCDPQKSVILVESCWGPPFFHEKGLQAAALMGSVLTAEQERCLDPFSVIMLALDNDRVGVQESASIRERLKVKHKVLNARLVE